ncbi:hypothetical protein L6452_30306 [Arctium lappa]|uniref:Uncharacterized protein n=1 Tax=Arctium lappa TaxID=4217 RepID=A0ACB8ZIH1_ARCLA|nr:hypothetical protein L6452_30306 [Arctium lappa]
MQGDVVKISSSSGSNPPSRTLINRAFMVARRISRQSQYSKVANVSNVFSLFLSYVFLRKVLCGFSVLTCLQLVF